MFIITLIYIPVTILTLYIAPIFIALGIDPIVANLTQQYVIVYLPGALFNTYADSVEMFLIATEFTTAVCIVMLACLPFHAFFCYLFIFILGFGFTGAAMAHNCTALFTVGFIFIYVKCVP